MMDATYSGNDFYPRPPRGGRPAKAYSSVMPGSISIHALREEGDSRAACIRPLRTYFYPRPPRGGRPAFRDVALINGLFLSTPSARRATVPCADWQRVYKSFLSTPSARRATGRSEMRQWFFGISIHALREEGDQARIVCCPWYPGISIHALREEGDLMRGCTEVITLLFLSTPSARRATASLPSKVRMLSLFLSTPSARRATVNHRGDTLLRFISIHALREEGDALP